MPQFFVKSSQIVSGKFVIDGEDFHHLAGVRRVKPGDEISLRTEDGASLLARIEIVGESELSGRIIEIKDREVLPVNLHLCVGLLKGRKLDLIIQKAVELGIHSIIPVVTERAVPDLSGKESGRMNRWRRIALEASKQSGRCSMPVIEEISSFNEVITRFNHTRIIAHPGGESGSLKDFLNRTEKSRDVSLLVGPEGGFSGREIQMATGHGWDAMHFGFTCLRAETAAIVLPAILIYEWSSASEDKGK